MAFELQVNNSRFRLLFYVSISGHNRFLSPPRPEMKPKPKLHTVACCQSSRSRSKACSRIFNAKDTELSSIQVKAAIRNLF